MIIQNRKSPRIPEYYYDTPNYYFITICTHNMQCIFGNPHSLNSYGKIAERNLLRISELNPGIKIHKYVIMPNHIHAILVVSAEDCEKGLKNVEIAVGLYKMSVTKAIRKIESQKQVWQRSFHDHIIRNQKAYEKIWLYIENNPLKWEEDCFYFGNQNV